VGRSSAADCLPVLGAIKGVLRTPLGGGPYGPALDCACAPAELAAMEERAHDEQLSLSRNGLPLRSTEYSGVATIP
jgi:hypothetical protein